MSEAIKSVTSAEFTALLEEKAVLVDFWAPWCGPCRMQGQILEELAKQLAGSEAVIAKVNIDDEQALAAKYQVSSIPTLLVFKAGKMVKQFVGVQQADTLKKALID